MIATLKIKQETIARAPGRGIHRWPSSRERHGRFFAYARTEALLVLDHSTPQGAWLEFQPSLMTALQSINQQVEADVAGMARQRGQSVVEAETVALVPE
jgi:hypothetical protein